MNPTDAPLFAALRDRMNFHTARQRVVAENVANASTPNFVPQDLSSDMFDSAVASALGDSQSGGGTSMMRTDPRHFAIAGELGGATFSPFNSPDSETTKDGNAVVVEEQMMKASKSRSEFETALALYGKSLGFLRLAARKAGG